MNTEINRRIHLPLKDKGSILVFVKSSKTYGEIKGKQLIKKYGKKFHTDKYKDKLRSGVCAIT